MFVSKPHSFFASSLHELANKFSPADFHDKRNVIELSNRLSSEDAVGVSDDLKFMVEFKLDEHIFYFMRIYILRILIKHIFQTNKIIYKNII